MRWWYVKLNLIREKQHFIPKNYVVLKVFHKFASDYYNSSATHIAFVYNRGFGTVSDDSDSSVDDILGFLSGATITMVTLGLPFFTDSVLLS